MTPRATLPLVVTTLGVAIACDDDGGPTETGTPVPVEVEMRLTDGLEPFKVAGRLDVEFRREIEGAEPTGAGSIVLPADARVTTADVVVPQFRGTLLARERTASSGLPFLTGESDPFVPRADLVVEIPLVLCSPPDTVLDDEGTPHLSIDPDCPPEIAD